MKPPKTIYVDLMNKSNEGELAEHFSASDKLPVVAELAFKCEPNRAATIGVYELVRIEKVSRMYQTQAIGPKPRISRSGR